MDFDNLSQTELAKLLKKAPRTLRDWIGANKDGDFPFPSHPGKVQHGSRVRPGVCYSLTDVWDWTIAAAVRDALRKVEDTPEGEQAQAAANLRKTLAEAETKELELARRKEELLEVADVERTWASALGRFRATLLGSRTSLAEDVLRLEQLTFIGVAEAYDKVIRAALTDLSELKPEDEPAEVEVPG